MSDIINIRKSVSTLEKQNQFDGYSKVVITVSDEVEYSAGADTGRTLTLTCPWGTQAMANNILGKIKGFQYQPYTATDAHIDPAAELGDGISAGNVYSGIYKKDISHGPLYTANVSAPGGEEINYQYEYKSKTERKIERQAKETKANFTVLASQISAEVEERQSDVESINSLLSLQSGQIEAKVSKTGGSSSSFGWVLDDSSWTIKANGSNVLKATKSGLEVTGKITATSGTIGGFTIKDNYLSSNNQTWGGTNTTGVYIGPSGIQLGKNFKVDSSGNLTAASGTFSGKVKAGNIEYGGSNGTMPGSALTTRSVSGGSSGALAAGTLSTYNLAGGVNTSLGYADYANGVFNGWNTATWFKGTYVNCRYLTVNEEAVAPMKITFATPSGGSRSIWVLGRTIS